MQHPTDIKGADGYDMGLSLYNPQYFTKMNTTDRMFKNV